MKVLRGLYISLFLLSAIHAQPADSVNFLPLSIGNIYQYDSGPQIPIETRYITNDTIIRNKRYFFTPFFPSPLRVDSIGNIWSADKIVSMEEDPEEYLILKADAKLDEIWVHSRNSRPINDSAYFQCIEDDTVYAYGKMRRIKGYIFYSFSPIYYHWYMEGIGIIKISGDMGIPVFLSYAKVNGTEYGKFVPVKNEEPSPAGQFTVSQNYPNPFNGSTNIKITIPENHRSETCRFKLCDLPGNLVYSETIPVNGSIVYRLNTDKLRLASGTYFYKVLIPGHTITRKLILMQ